MKISGVGFILYILGLISLLVELVVVVITSLQAKEFVWVTPDNWWWFGISAAAIVIGIVLAFGGVIGAGSRMMKD